MLKNIHAGCVVTKLHMWLGSGAIKTLDSYWCESDTLVHSEYFGVDS